MEIINSSIINDIDNILSMLNTGKASDRLKDPAFCDTVSHCAIELINNPKWDNERIHLADSILRISNIVYNNTDNEILPLDDGVYDQLAVIYYRYNPNYQVGAHPIVFNNSDTNNEIKDDKVMCISIDDNEMDSKMYIRDIWKQNIPIHEMRPVNMCFIVKDPITKRLINTTHKYPELVGTLDKCKFVLNNDALTAGVLDKPSVQVFERDFIHHCLDLGVITPDEKFEMVGELKYDGISVEAEVCGDTIIAALSRGDTADNIATDLTPIFGGYKFHNASEVPRDITFGIKFEAVITHYDLNRLAEVRGRTYKNGRNAIIGLCGASDADKYIDYITLIPLSTSLDMDRITELKFLNKYYHSGQYNRYCTFYGDYQSILYQVKQFTDSAESIRNVLPYMIDGVVISFTDKDKIKKLGRYNSVNKYSMAIKFNPRSARTYFTGYTYSIGKTGDIIPMAHFKACEFIGGIHTKQTIHSYKRFKELNLAIGNEIDIDYVNDVITYITKPDTEYNRNLKEPPVQFIINCPCCGTELVISESGKTAKCPNVNCYERCIMKMVSMLDRFGFKDFSEETVRALNLTSFNQLMNLTYEQVKFLGPINSSNLLSHIERLKTTPIADYRLMSAFSFDGIADETWKSIFKVVTINDIVNDINNIEKLNNDLLEISGIGSKTVSSIISGMHDNMNDIKYCINNFNIINYKNEATRPRVVLSGFRDASFIQLLNDNGFDAADNYSINKNTDFLIVADKNASSSKIDKANKYGIPIYNRDEFLSLNNIKIV